MGDSFQDQMQAGEVRHQAAKTHVVVDIGDRIHPSEAGVKVYGPYTFSEAHGKQAEILQRGGAYIEDRLEIHEMQEPSP